MEFEDVMLLMPGFILLMFYMLYTIIVDVKSLYFWILFLIILIIITLYGDYWLKRKREKKRELYGR